MGESLDRVTSSIGAATAKTLSAVFSRWEDLVGSDIAAHAVPKSVRDGVLLVEVDQPAWATQLGYLSTDLLAKLQASAGTSEVAEIRFRVGSEQARRKR